MEWRPIDEKYHRCGVRMLLSGTYEGHKWIEIGFRSKISGRWTMGHGGSLLGVTHWMPLPDLPD